MSNDNPAASGPAAPPSTRDQHEEKIKALSNFVTAVNAGQYHGRDAVHIAALLNLLTRECDAAMAQYEAERLTHPEWGVRQAAKA